LNDYAFNALNLEYDKVGNLTWEEPDFLIDSLESSRALFISSSLSQKDPTPKDLEVFALVSGLEFSKKLQDLVVELQLEIDRITNHATRYWVRPENLGIEYCVFKWPADRWNSSLTDAVHNKLTEIKFLPFNLYIGGVQINGDGCVILKGFDQFQSLFRIRNTLRDKIDFLPKRQSNWAHIPIGRILDPIGEQNFNHLRDYIQKRKFLHIHTELINDAKFVHETQWYMEKKIILKRIS
jgi:hypothetical protein